jgi:hypothetical protein
MFFIEEPLRNKIALYGILILVYIISILAAFAIGMDHQKRIGPHGNECADGVYRQPGSPGGGAVCENGFWFELAPEAFPRDKLEDKQ